VDLDLGISLAGLAVGVVVGLTGMGGGALMTPLLVLGFGVPPLTAVSSDIVASVVMKPIGGGIHWRRGTVHVPLVLWLATGTVPGALGGAYLVSHLGHDASDTIKTLLGVVLLIAAGAMVARAWVSRHRVPVPPGTITTVHVRRVVTVVIGVLGGLVVGMTSVGSGSLMIVALLFVYPRLTSREIVGTDLVQAVPLVVAAAIGHLIWGDLELPLTASLLLGCVPGVIIGAHVSSRAPDGLIRPILLVVLTASALKLLDVPDEVVAVAVGVLAAVAIAVTVAARRRPGRVVEPEPEPVFGFDEDPGL
jgi:uncharacterized membrane protein YfcA